MEIKVHLFKIMALASLFFLTSCGPLISTIQKKGEVKLIPKIKDTYCHEPTKLSYNSKTKTNSLPFTLASEDSDSQFAYKEMIQSLKRKKIHLNDTDRFILWAMTQVLYRPDMASPTSRLQLLIHNNIGPTYYDFIVDETLLKKTFPDTSSNSSEDKHHDSIPSKEDQEVSQRMKIERNLYPYLYGLYIAKKSYGGQFKLTTYAKWVDQYVSSGLSVTQGFSKFLKKFEKGLRDNSIFSRFFFKGNQIVKQYESFGKLTLTSTLKKFSKSIDEQEKFILKLNHLFQYIPDNNSENLNVQCNFDLELYKDNIFNIDPELTEGHKFIYQGKKITFMAYSTQKITNPRPIANTAFISGSSLSEGHSLCTIKKDKFYFNLMSSEGHDTGQHLYHLIKYQIYNLETLREIDELLSFSRYLFLLNPTRLLYESRRGTKKQLDGLLKLNIPIYQTTDLGHVWAVVKTDKLDHIILDNRHPGELSCMTD